MQTGVYFGWIMFPSAWVNFKLHEVAKNYTEVGFGAITWHGLTINKIALAASQKKFKILLSKSLKSLKQKLVVSMRKTILNNSLN